MLSRQKRELRRKRIADAKARVEQSEQPANPADYLAHLQDLPPGPVLRLCRVSARQQRIKGNLHDQQNAVQAGINAHGSWTAAIYNHVGPGWDWDEEEWNRIIDRAASLSANVAAESSDRIRRSRDYWETNQDAVPTAEQWEAAVAYAKQKGVLIATVLHPSATPEEIRAHQRKRGQAFKSKGGRRRKRRGTKAMLLLSEKAKALHKTGMGKRDIGKALNVPESTVRRWLKSASK